MESKGVLSGSAAAGGSGSAVGESTAGGSAAGGSGVSAAAEPVASLSAPIANAPAAAPKPPIDLSVLGDQDPQFEWCDMGFPLKSLDDGRLPIIRGGYSPLRMRSHALYIDVDFKTLTMDLTNRKSRMATLYAGEDKIQRILIAKLVVISDHTWPGAPNKTIAIEYFRIECPQYTRKNGGSATLASATLASSPVTQALWDEDFFSKNRVFFDIWM